MQFAYSVIFVFVAKSAIKLWQKKSALFRQFRLSDAQVVLNIL